MYVYIIHIQQTKIEMPVLHNMIYIPVLEP